MYSNDSFNPKIKNFSFDLKNTLKTARIEGNTKIALFSEDINSKVLLPIKILIKKFIHRL